MNEKVAICSLKRAFAGGRSFFKGWKLFPTVLFALVLVLSGWKASGAAISFQATDLTDTTVGQDLWNYSYTLSGFNFQTNQGFTIYFGDSLYRNLHNAQPSSGTDWNMLGVQPDLILHQPGFLDGQALVNSPSLGVTFQVDFIWLGAGVPGAQPFDIYDSNFSTITSGTSTVVPEPQSAVLLSLASIFAFRKFVLRFGKTVKSQTHGP